MEHHHDHHGDERMESLKKNRSKLTIVLVITITFAVVEVIGGIISNSLALLSDAGHMVVDSGAIALSLFAVHLSMKPSTPTNTYSLVRMEIVAAFVNGLTLMALAGYIFYEAVERLGSPPEIKGGVMLAVAVIGMLVNIIAAWILWGASHDNMNIKGALLHVLGDFAGSVGAVVAAIIVIYTGWTLADPIVSMMIGLLIIRSSWTLLKESLHVLLEGTPRGLDTEEIIKRIKSIDGVNEIHDFHVWSLTTGMTLLTAHICVSDPEEGIKVLESVTKMLEDDFGLSHSTIQIEDSKSGNCRVKC